MTSLKALYLRIAADRFHYLKFILEGYDNLALLSSIDAAAGVVVLRYPEESEVELFALLVGIAPQLAPGWCQPIGTTEQ